MHHSKHKPSFQFPLRVFLLLVLLAFGTEQQASAYTDPGTGALIWQAALAGIAGIGFYFRRISAWFKNRKVQKD